MKPMNVFDRLIARARAEEIRLGCPARDPAAIDRRVAAFAAMTGGCGFRQWPQTPRTDNKGLSRGDRKRAAQAALRVKILEDRSKPDTRRGHR
jgi:hypothetical protein